MMDHPLKVLSLIAVAVSFPMKRPLGTSAQTIRFVPLLLVTLETEEGIKDTPMHFVTWSRSHGRSKYSERSE
jgi:hypothetical protein